MANRYPFMREFTGIPLDLTDGDRRQARADFVRAGAWLHIAFLGVVERTPQEDGSAFTSLTLLHEAGEEMVTVDAYLDPDDEVLDATIMLNSLVRGLTDRRHRYSVGPNRRVEREDTFGVQARRTMDESDARNFGKRNARALETGQAPEPSAGPKSSVNMSEFYALTHDAVTPEEITGLRQHLEQKVDSRLYVPISYERALQIDGLL